MVVEIIKQPIFLGNKKNIYINHNVLYKYYSKNKGNKMKRNFRKYNYLLFGVIILLLSTSKTLFPQVHSATSAHTSFTGLSMTGYQGWFGTTKDGITNSWRHYGGNGGFEPGKASIEYWPDMREADEDEKYITPFTFDDGSPAYVFSSVHPKTVSRHFQWMKEYGIDGALMQRFSSDVANRPYTMDVILKNGLDAAREHGRAIGLMYDVSGNVYVNGEPNDAKRTQEVNKLFNDWKKAVDNLGLTTGGDDQPYLYHNGKPLIVLWGVGFSHRHHSTGLDMEYWVNLSIRSKTVQLMVVALLWWVFRENGELALE